MSGFKRPTHKDIVIMNSQGTMCGPYRNYSLQQSKFIKVLYKHAHFYFVFVLLAFFITLGVPLKELLRPTMKW